MSANDDLVDRAIAHQVELSKYSNGVVRRLIAILNRADSRMAAELSGVLETIGDVSTFRVERLESMLASVRALNAQAYSQIEQELRTELREFTEYEANWQQMTLREAIPPGVSVSFAGVSVEQVYAAALARPFQGVLLKGALDDLSEQSAKLVRQTISAGIVEGRTTQQIIRDLRGTRAKGYADGLLQRSRRDVEAIVRTAISHTAGVVQDNVMQANTDLLQAVQWSSTIDLRTSEICRIRDGKLYTPDTHKPIGHSLPWGGGPGRAHWRCRSAQVPVLRSWRAMGIDMDGSANLDGTRASLDGQLPQDITYAQWIEKQSAARQDEVLGPSRGKLLREGKLPMEALYSQSGQFLTLQQLHERHAGAFRKAGVTVK
jgi:hypothetical protein